MNTTDDGLLPCPFCGGSARTILVHDGWAVLCVGCDLQAGFDTTEEKATRYWNTRTTPSLVTDDEVERALNYVVKMARQYEAAVMRVPDAIHGAGERLEQAKRELLAASDRDVLVGRIAELEQLLGR